MNLSKIQFLSTISEGLDLAEGRNAGHAVRVSQLCIRIAEAIGWQQEDQYRIALAGLLHDVGISSISSSIYSTVQENKLTDHAVAKFHSDHFQGRLVRPPLTGQKAKQVQEHFIDHCAAGAEIGHRILKDTEMVAAIANHHERWDGSGYSQKTSGQKIPLAARILALADLVDLLIEVTAGSKIQPDFSVLHGLVDPELLELLIDSLKSDKTASPQQSGRMITSGIDLIDKIKPSEKPFDVQATAKIIARIIDHKSSYTQFHSTAVADLCQALGRKIGLPDKRLDVLSLTAYLHDLGKLGIPNSILEKKNSLNPFEWQIIRQHPKWSENILQGCRSLKHVAFFAGRHHERLDGQGYWRGLPGYKLNPEIRILSLCDIFSALTENRPHRQGIEVRQALQALRSMFNTAVDPELAALLPEIVDNQEDASEKTAPSFVQPGV